MVAIQRRRDIVSGDVELNFRKIRVIPGDVGVRNKFTNSPYLANRCANQPGFSSSPTHTIMPSGLLAPTSSPNLAIELICADEALCD